MTFLIIYVLKKHNSVNDSFKTSSIKRRNNACKGQKYNSSIYTDIKLEMYVRLFITFYT